MAHMLSRSAAQKLRVSVSALPTQYVPKRTFAAGHGHGPAKKNFWEAPSDPGSWKEEHFVLISLAGWGSIFYLGFKAATGGSKKPVPMEQIPAEAQH